MGAGWKEEKGPGLMLTARREVVVKNLLFDTGPGHYISEEGSNSGYQFKTSFEISGKTSFGNKARLSCKQVQVAKFVCL